MFCPGCGTEVSEDQDYCRTCGHHLAGPRAALEKNLEEIRSMIKGGAMMVGVAFLAVTLYVTISFISSLVEKNPAGVSFVFVGLLLMLPLMLFGLLRLARAARSLKQTTAQVAPTPGEARIDTTASASPGQYRALPEEPPSVTEKTTLHLERPGRPRESQ